MKKFVEAFQKVFANLDVAIAHADSDFSVWKTTELKFLGNKRALEVAGIAYDDTLLGKACWIQGSKHGVRDSLGC